MTDTVDFSIWILSKRETSVIMCRALSEITGLAGAKAKVLRVGVDEEEDDIHLANVGVEE